MNIGIIKQEIMNMTPNDCAIMIAEKDDKIYKLERKVESLKRKCDRYEKRLRSVYLNGEFE